MLPTRCLIHPNNFVPYYIRVEREASAEDPEIPPKLLQP